MSALTEEDIRQFNHEGYLVFEGLLDNARNERIMRDVDQLMEDRKVPNRPAIPMRYPELGPPDVRARHCGSSGISHGRRKVRSPSHSCDVPHVG